MSADLPYYVCHHRRFRVHCHLPLPAVAISRSAARYRLLLPAVPMPSCCRWRSAGYAAAARHILSAYIVIAIIRPIAAAAAITPPLPDTRWSPPRCPPATLTLATPPVPAGLRRCPLPERHQLLRCRQAMTPVWFIAIATITPNTTYSGHAWLPLVPPCHTLPLR